MKNKKKASRAKKAAAAATRNTNLSPRQEVEPELRMPAWLSAFVEQFLRLPRMPAMPAWLSAFVQRFQLVPVVVVVQEVPARKKPGGFQAKMYGFSRKSASALARAQEPAPRHFDPGPSIAQLLAKDAEVIDPYEQKTRHIDYLNIRATSKSEWDICSVCYFEDSEPEEVKKKNLNKHFDNNHLEHARGSCSVWI